MRSASRIAATASGSFARTLSGSQTIRSSPRRDMTRSIPMMCLLLLCKLLYSTEPHPWLLPCSSLFSALLPEVCIIIIQYRDKMSIARFQRSVKGKLASCQTRKRKREHTSLAWYTLDSHTPTVQLHNGFDCGKPQTLPTGTPPTRARHLIKTLKDTLLVLCSNATPSISHLYLHPPILRVRPRPIATHTAGGNPNTPIRRRKAQRITYKIA